MDEKILARKGPRKAEDIAPEVLNLLNSGKIETVNLTEWLATDQLKVLQVVLKKIKKEKLFVQFEKAVNSQKKISANNNTRVIGQMMNELLDQSSIQSILADHRSDIVRCWACWALTREVNAISKLAAVIKPFAADSHFGVREVAIFATKEKFAQNIESSIKTLAKWTSAKDENVRRFAVEGLRPIGVWTKKIEELQQNPALGGPLLHPLKSDPSKYVQNSVANWLNDASKSKPDWVRTICQQWEKESDTKATQYIVKRAMRTINK